MTQAQRKSCKLVEQMNRDRIRLEAARAFSCIQGSRLVTPQSASGESSAPTPERTKGRADAALINNSLHDDLVNTLDQRGALIISEAMLDALVLDSLKASSIASSGAGSFPTSHEKVLARVSSSTLDVNKIYASFEPTNPASEKAEVIVRPGFQVTFTLFATNASHLSFSDVVLDVPEFSVELTGRKQAIEFRAKEFLVSSRVNESVDREQAKLAAQITENDLLRIEGIFAYGGVASKLIDEAMGEIPDIDLAAMFPAIDFGGSLELRKIGEHLVIVPEKFSVLGNSGCPQGDVLDGVRPVPQNPVQNDQEARIPLFFDTSRARVIPKARNTFGFAGTYIPKALLDVKFGKVSPGASHKDSGGGTFKWLLDLSVALKGIRVEIDEQLLALRLTVHLESSGYGELWLNLPCIGRTTVAIVRVELPETGSPPSTVQVLLRPVVNSNGELRIAAGLESVNLGDVYVRVELFGRWVGGDWKAKVLAFIADAILARFIAWKIPSMVCDELRKNINKHFFVLVSIERLTRYLRRAPDVPAFSARPQSALLSMTLSDW
jgi:hypothetical protein